MERGREWARAEHPTKTRIANARYIMIGGSSAGVGGECNIIEGTRYGDHKLDELLNRKRATAFLLGYDKSDTRYLPKVVFNRSLSFPELIERRCCAPQTVLESCISSLHWSCSSKYLRQRHAATNPFWPIFFLQVCSTKQKKFIGKTLVSVHGSHAPHTRVDICRELVPS